MKIMKYFMILVLCGACLMGVFTGCKKSEVYNNSSNVCSISPYQKDVAEKPVIYLYPKQTTDVTVKLDYQGTLTCTYPEYPAEGWRVTANPDGTLTNKADGKEYSYLFWEGVDDAQYDLSQGFVVKGKDTRAFLQEKLAYMGLTPKEYNEFIVYWLPKMEHNPYNLIAFQGKAYTDTAKLTVTPTPDSVLRVFMTYQPLKEHKQVPEQTLSQFERKGFTVVEWGGCEVKP